MYHISIDPTLKFTSSSLLHLSKAYVKRVELRLSEVTRPGNRRRRAPLPLSATMSSTPAQKDAKADGASAASKDEKAPAAPAHVAALEEDDEFEEFPAQGACTSILQAQITVTNVAFIDFICD